MLSRSNTPQMISYDDGIVVPDTHLSKTTFVTGIALEIAGYQRAVMSLDEGDQLDDLHHEHNDSDTTGNPQR